MWVVRKSNLSLSKDFIEDSSLQNRTRLLYIFSKEFSLNKMLTNCRLVSAKCKMLKLTGISRSLHIGTWICVTLFQVDFFIGLLEFYSII